MVNLDPAFLLSSPSTDNRAGAKGLDFSADEAPNSENPRTPTSGFPLLSPSMADESEAKGPDLGPIVVADPENPCPPAGPLRAQVGSVGISYSAGIRDRMLMEAMLRLMDCPTCHKYQNWSGARPI